MMVTLIIKGAIICVLHMQSRAAGKVTVRH